MSVINDILDNLEELQAEMAVKGKGKTFPICFYTGTAIEKKVVKKSVPEPPAWGSQTVNRDASKLQEKLDHFQKTLVF